MKRTTMTVAAFLAVAAVSYAAKPVNGGNTVTISKGGTTVTETFTLKKGTYEIKVSGISSNDNFAIDGAELSDGKYTVNDVEKNITFNVVLATPAGENGQKVTITFIPKDTDWNYYKETTLQNILSTAFSLSTRLPQDEDFEQKKRQELVDRGIELQAELNALGVEDYEKFLANGNKLPELDEKLEDYNKDADIATQNVNQYEKATNALKGISYSELDVAYNASSKSPEIKKLYENAKNAVPNSIEDVMTAYKAGTAHISYNDVNITRVVAELQKIIDNATKSIKDGNENLWAYLAINTQIQGLLQKYNNAVDDIYTKTSAIEQGTYEDKYQAALIKLNTTLQAINTVNATNEQLFEDGKHNKTEREKLEAKINELPANFITDDIQAIFDEVARLKASYDESAGEIKTKLDAIKSIYDAACKDARKDSKGTSISTYFSDKRQAIVNMLGTLKEQLDAANKKHEHENSAKWETETVSWKEINKLVDKLAVDHAEYTVFCDIQNANTTLSEKWNKDDKKNPGIKQQVDAMKLGSFVATDHFSDAAILKALSDYATQCNVYVLGSQYNQDATKHTPCQDFWNNKHSKLNTTANSAMDTYKNVAQAAYDNYKTISTAITNYNDQIDGKGKEGETGYIAKWSSIIKNDYVTINGEINGKTYAAAKSEQDAVKNAAQTELNNAIAIAKEKESDFSAAMSALANTTEPKVNVATGEIIKLKDEAKYKENEENWLKAVNKDAAEKAKKEATDMTANLLNSIKSTNYAAIDYGTAAAAKLNQEIAGYETTLNGYQTDINDVPDEPTKAIVYLAEIKKKLDATQVEITKHQTKATNYKAVFAEVKNIKDGIDHNINGLVGEKGEIKIKSIKEMLGSVNNASTSHAGTVIAKFTTESNKANTDLSTLWTKIDNSEDIAAGRADKNDEKDPTKVIKGFNTLLNEIAVTVNTLRTNATNEDANQLAMDDWNKLINEYRTIVEAGKDKKQSVENILQAAETAIRKANGKPAEDSDGELYFLGLVNNKRSAVAQYGKNASTAYQTQKNGYTDTEKNIKAQYATLKTYIDQIVTEADGLGAKALANEVAHAEQEKKIAEAKDKYNEVNMIVNSSEAYEGTEYEELFKSIVEQLTGINAEIKKYGTEYVENYKKGTSSTFDAGAVTAQGYIDALNNIQKVWESDDKGYNNAVAKDNETQKNLYLDEWQKLYNFYYGTPDGVIAVVNKLKSLSMYSDNLSDELKGIVTGDNSLYTKADDIQALKDAAIAEYNKAEAGEIWLNKAHVNAVKDLKDEITTMRDTYADAINGAAKAEYTTLKKDADDAISTAETDIKAVVMKNQADDKKLNQYMSLAKVPNTNSSVLEIQKAAKDSEDDVDFAFTFVTNLRDALKNVPNTCQETKNKAAEAEYKDKYVSVNTTDEANLIATFMYKEGANAQTPSSDFVLGGYSKTYRDYVQGENGAWKVLTNGDGLLFKDFTTEFDKLQAQITSYTEGKKTWPCTEAFKKAWNSNEQYKKNLANETELNKIKAEIESRKAVAQNYAKNLLVEHDAQIAAKLALIEIITVNDKAQAITDIETVKSMIFDKEYAAVGLEITKLVTVIGQPTDETKALNEENAKIYEELTVGKKDKDGKPILDKNGDPVLLTYEEAYNAYLALEKKISEELSKKLPDALTKAQERVNTALGNAETATTTATNAHGGAHRKNREKFQSQIDKLNADLKALKDKIELQGNAIIIEQDNNIKAAENIIADAKNVKAAIDAAEVNYLDTDDFDDAIRLEVINIQKKLTQTISDIKILEYIEDLEETTVEDYQKTYTKVLEDNVNEIVSTINNDLSNLIPLLDAGKVGDWNTAKNTINTSVAEALKEIITKKNYALRFDGTKSFEKIYEEYKNLEEYANTTLTVNTTQKEKIDKELGELKEKLDNAKDYFSSVLPDNDKLDSESTIIYRDINGTEIKDGKTVVRATEYDSIKDVLADASNQMTDIRNKIITPGAITNGNKIESDDISKMVNFILGTEVPANEQEKTAADVNDNKRFDVADLQYIIDKYLNANAAKESAARSLVAATMARHAGSLGMFANASNLNVTLETEMAYTAVQMDVTLPAGVILTDAAQVADIDGVSVKFNKIGDHTWRVLAFSNNNENIIENLDFLNLSLAGKGTGVVSISNVKGAAANGSLLTIRGIEDNMDITTGISSTVAEAKAIIYGIDGRVRQTLDKGVNIIKDAAGKVKKVIRN